MMQAWLILLYPSHNEGFFSNENTSIKGVFINGEWVVDVRVETPHFAWGCNKFHTGLAVSFDKVVDVYIKRVRNQLQKDAENV